MKDNENYNIDLPTNLPQWFQNLWNGGHTPKWNYRVKKDCFDQISESPTTISEWGVTPSLYA